MELPDRLRCLFSGEVTERDGSYVVEIPEREIELDNVSAGRTYQVAVLESPSADTHESTRRADRRATAAEPPVDEGETRRVEIEDIGDQGDGIARVERGYVVVVPDTDVGERVRISVTDVRENVAFATVVERLSYYD